MNQVSREERFVIHVCGWSLSHIECCLIFIVNRFEDYVEQLKSVTFVNLFSQTMAMVFVDSLLPYLVQPSLTLVVALVLPI